MQLVLAEVSDHCAMCAPCPTCNRILHNDSTICLCHIHFYDENVRRWLEARVALHALAQT